MPRVLWPLRQGRPSVQIILTLTPGGQTYPRTLLADTGAGPRNAVFELVLDHNDCLLCGGYLLQRVLLGGAYAGSFPIYIISVQVPALGINMDLPAVGVPSVPIGFDGIACFAFLNRFTYGNFGDPGQFGLEC